MTPLPSAGGTPRKVLVIAYHFPPDAAVGAVRTAKFVKYLSRLGWKPYVLTVREEYAPVQDRSRIGDLPAVPVARTRMWPTLVQLALRFKATRMNGRPATPQAPGGAVIREGIAARLKRYLTSIFELPDAHVGWLVPAVFQAYRIIRTERIDVVMTSSPPRTTALVGLILSYIAPVRLVTDLRDPWFSPYMHEAWFTSLPQIATSRSALRDAIEQWLERKLLERSARVIVTNERLAVAVRAAYATLPGGRVITIPNGYDTDDAVSVNGATHGGTFTMSYLGTLYLHRSPRSIFQALAELIRDGRLVSADVLVNLIGDVQSTTDGSAEDLVASYGLTDCVRITGPVSYTESLRQMAQSDLLLLFAPNQHCSIPAKAFEYLSTRKPILCLAQDGATADLIKATGAGFVVDPEDVAGIKAALITLVDAFHRGQQRINDSDISRYERRALSDELSRLLLDIDRDMVVRTDGKYTAQATVAD